MKCFPRQFSSDAHSFFGRSFLSLRRYVSPVPGRGMNGWPRTARAFDFFLNSIHTGRFAAVINC